MSIRSKNIVIVAHKYLTQPDDELVNFLVEQKAANVMFIRHSFSDAADRISYFTWYREGAIYKKGRTRDFNKWPELFIYLKEFYFTWHWLVRAKVRWDKYIGLDGLCVYFGLFFRLIRLTKKVVFWAMDFVPEKRFGSRIVNWIYHSINIAGYQRSDEMWDLAPRMVEAREKFLGFSRKRYRKNRLVPYGVWLDRIKRYSYDQCNQKTIVFMGHMLEKQGAQLVLRALPLIIQRIPNIQYKLIGGGNYLDSLIIEAKRLGVYDYCKFLGRVEDITKVEAEIARSAVAVAPYIKELDTWTYYADPGKIKTYLACGVPVVMTDIPWNAHQIQEAHCGLICSEEPIDLAQKILYLLEESHNRAYRQNAIEFARTFNYKNIFNRLSL